MRTIEQCFEASKAVVVFAPHGNKGFEEFADQAGVFIRGHAVPDITIAEIGCKGFFDSHKEKMREELTDSEFGSMFRLWGSGGLRTLSYESVSGLMEKGMLPQPKVPLDRRFVVYLYRASEGDTEQEVLEWIEALCSRAGIFNTSSVVVVEALEDESIPPAFSQLGSRPYLSMVSRMPMPFAK